MQIEFPTQKIEAKVEWGAVLRQNLNYIIGFVLALVSLGVLLTKMVGLETSSLNDFYQANFQLNRLYGKGELNEEILAKLMKDHPELKPAFSPYFTQVAVDRGEINLAKDLVAESLSRLSYIDSRYLDYVQGSVIIQEGLYDEALKGALALQDQISLENEPKLYLFNALRVGFLHRVLGHEQEARDQLLYVKALLTEEEHGVDSKTRSAMIFHLGSEQASVFDLIGSAS